MYDKNDVKVLEQKSHPHHQQHQHHDQHQQQQQQDQHQQQEQINNEILLNSFFIKKKRYRVLLNLDKLTWEQEHQKNAHKELSVYDIIAVNITNSKRNNFIKKTIGCQQQQQHSNSIPNSSNIFLSTSSSSSSSAASSTYESSAQFSNQAFQKTESIDDLNSLPIIDNNSIKSANNILTTTTTTATTSINNNNNNNSNKIIIKKEYLIIYYASRLKDSRNEHNRWRKKKLILYNFDTKIIKQWFLIITNILNKQKQRPKNILMFVNPYGGRKKGVQIYEKQCKPLFELAGIDVSFLLTQRPNQIRDILMKQSLEHYDGICCVGGDGTFAEVFNGMLYRTINDFKLDPLQPDYIPKPKLPLGIIPGGSTDTIAYCMHGTCDVQTAAIHIILGQKRGLDLASVWNSNGLIRFYCSVLSYGFLGDIALDSEKFRWMGPKRYEYSGFKKFLQNRGYYGEIILLSDESQSQLISENSIASTSIGCIPNGERESNDIIVGKRSLRIGNSSSSLDYTDDLAEKKCYINCMRCESSLQSINMKNSTNKLNEQTNSISDNENNKISKSCDSLIYESNNNKYDEELRKILNFQQSLFVEKFSVENSNATNRVVSSTLDGEDTNAAAAAAAVNCDIDVTTVDEQEESLTNKLKIIKGKFFLVSAPNISCACNRSPKGLSEFSHLGDGYLDIILVRHTNFFNNIRLLLEMSSRRGNMSNLPFVESYRTKKFLFKTQKSFPLHTDLINNSSDQQQISNTIIEDRTSPPTSQWNCDGELIFDSDLFISSHCQLVDVFMRGPYPVDTTTENGCCGRF